MRRALVRGIEGTLNADLTTGSTTISADILASLPALTGLTYIPIVIDPNAVGAGTEVVYLELHTASATTGTIRRAREGTTDPGISHASGVPIIVAMTENDVQTSAILVDKPWGGDDSGNVEFQRIDEPTSLPSGFAWVNQGGATFVERLSCGVVVAPANASSSLRCITKALPAGWGTTLTEVQSKCNMITPPLNFIGAGFLLRESSSGKLVQVSMSGSTNVPQWSINAWTNTTTLSSTLASRNMYLPAPYARVKRNSASSYDFYCSADGVYWFPMLLAYNMGAFMTPDQFGIFANSNNNGTAVATVCDWIRFR